MIRIFRSALSIASLGALLIVASGSAFAAVSSSAAHRAIQSELNTEEAAMARGNAQGSVKYDDPHYQLYTQTGAIRIPDKPTHLQGNIKICKFVRNWNISDKIQSISLSGNQATVMVTKTGSYQFVKAGHTITMLYTGLEKQVWNKTGPIWTEQVGFIKQAALSPKQPAPAKAK